MSRHTAGPWTLWGRPDPAQTIASETGFVATTVGGNDLANARLIAAAPDLLDVLLAIQADQSWRTNDNSLWPRINEVVRLATQPLPPPNEE